MRIEILQSQILYIPLRIRFAQSSNSTQTSHTALVRLRTSEGTYGYGEACPRSYVTQESYASLVRDLQHIKEALLHQHFEQIDDIKYWVTEVLPGKVGPSTICALELALLDAWSKQYRQSLWSYFSTGPDQGIAYSGICPLAPSSALLHQIQQMGFQEIKLKVDQDLATSLATIQKIKDHLGPDLPLRVDANCSWTLNDAFTQIPALLEAGIYCFEQPFPPERDGDMMRLCTLYGQNAFFMADESLLHWQSAQSIIQKGYFNRFNIKISKNGGIFNSLRIAKLGRQAGLAVQLGAHFGETSLLSGAGLLLASANRSLSGYEGGLGTYLLKEDICQPSIQMNQEAQVPSIKNSLPEFGLAPVCEDRLPAFDTTY